MIDTVGKEYRPPSGPPLPEGEGLGVRAQRGWGAGLAERHVSALPAYAVVYSYSQEWALVFQDTSSAAVNHRAMSASVIQTPCPMVNRPTLRL